VILILSLNINLPLKDYIYRKHLASSINIFNYYNLFLIAWLCHGLEALKTYDLGLDGKKLLREKSSWGRGDRT
jgi:hypothetical protein